MLDGSASPHHCCQQQVLFKIASAAPPTLDSARGFSDSMYGFLATCLMKDASARATGKLHLLLTCAV